MKPSLSYLLLAAMLAFPSVTSAQGGFGGRRGGMGGPGPDRFAPSAPRLPGVELEGPLDTAMAHALLKLSDQQATRYSQVYDSFMVATRPQRDSVGVAMGKMNERLDGGDRAAAMFYVDLIQDLGKYLKDRQDKFESNLHRWLSDDQVKAYRRWKEGEQQALEGKRREDALRWREAEFAGGGVGRPRTLAAEPRTIVTPPSGIAAPAPGPQAGRVGGTGVVGAPLRAGTHGAVRRAGLP